MDDVSYEFLPRDEPAIIAVPGPAPLAMPVQDLTPVRFAASLRAAFEGALVPHRRRPA